MGSTGVGGRLDWTILEAFSNTGDSVILCGLKWIVVSAVFCLLGALHINFSCERGLLLQVCHAAVIPQLQSWCLRRQFLEAHTKC